MQFMNDHTGELLGDLADISPDGFRLEGSKPLQVNAEFPFRVDLPPGTSQKPCIVFTARSRWCRQNSIDRRLHESGFEIVSIDPGDSRVLGVIFDGCRPTGTVKDSGLDYLWKS
jgi:hypothetical protein